MSSETRGLRPRTPSPAGSLALARPSARSLRSRALMCWLDELDEALVGTAPTADAERRLDALIDEGVTLLAGEAPADAATIDAHVIDRVQRRLRAIADQVADELDAVRRTRRDLARAGKAHAGYRAVATP